MRLGPLIPLQFNGGAGSNSGMLCTRRGILSAYDVAATILVGRDKSSIRSVISPTNNFGRVVSLKGKGTRIESLIAMIGVRSGGGKDKTNGH